jgi:hypothetical protein
MAVDLTVGGLLALKMVAVLHSDAAVLRGADSASQRQQR